MSEQDRIRETYRRYAAGGREHLWEESNPGFARLSRDRDRELLSLTLGSLPAGEARLLDVGCGDGRHIAAVLLERPDLEAVGVDLLEERVAQAGGLVPGATFRVGSADHLPFDSGSFDVVSAITLFSSLPTSQLEAAAAAEIARVLKPGGWLVWFDLRYDNPSNHAVHGIGQRQLAELFPRWAGEVRSITLLPPIARRLGRATSVLYPVLHAIPPLRSHLIGRLRCPT